MRSIRYSVAMSLDGYIAGPRGESDWIVMDPDIDFASHMDRFDTILMGRRTFEATGGRSMPGTRTVVVSRTMRQEDYQNLQIIGANLRESIDRLRGEEGRDIWLFGGGSLFRSMLDAELVDAVEVAIIPVVLGDGIPLLPPGRQAAMELVGHKVYEKTGTVVLEYAVGKGNSDAA